MKPLFRLISAALLLATAITFMSPVRPAAASCLIGSATNPPATSITFNQIAGHTYFGHSSIGLHFFSTATFTGPRTLIVFANETFTIFDESVPDCGGAKFFNPGDDRLNRDPGQPAALYCRNGGDVHIYSVSPDSRGKLALIVTKAQIDAVVNANPTANTLIKQSTDGKLKLYYLPATKELSFITHENGTGKQYSHVWKGLCR